MDDFIDDEINSAEENEPVLLDLKDLLSLKKGTINDENEKKKEKEIRLAFNLNYNFNSLKYTENDTSDDKEFLIHRNETDMHKKNEEIQNRDSVINRIISKFKTSAILIYSKCKKSFHVISLNVKTKFNNEKKKKQEGYNIKSSYFTNEWLHVLVNRLYYSKITSFIYVFVFLVNLCILIYGIFISRLSKSIVAAEIFVIAFLLFEVSLRMLTIGTIYFYKVDGVFDVTITLLSILLLINSGDLRVFFEINVVKTNSSEIEEIVSQSLTAIRFSLQLFRMITLFMHHKRTKAPTADIDFSLLNVSHDDI